MTLTVTSPGGGSATRSVAVTPQYVASTPTAVSISPIVPVGYGVTANYTLSGGKAPYTVKTTWGDGSTQTATGVAAGANSVTHNYVNSGTYTVTVTATDSGVNGGYVTTKSANTSVTIVPSTFTVSGKVTRVDGTTPVAAAPVTLKLNGVAKKLAYTAADGTYTMTGVAPGTYTATVTKSGVTFANPAATITVSGSATLNITATN